MSATYALIHSVYNVMEKVASEATTARLISDNHLELQQQEDRELTCSSTNQRRRRPYLNILAIVRKCKGSLHLAFTSHFCFILASLFYVRLAFVDLAWVQDTRNNYHVPAEVLDEDDDEIWSDWASSNENGTIVEDMREDYYVQSKLLYILGAAFFVLVGIFDCMRYCDVMNVFMILAGAAGVVSGMSDTSREE
eukprot:CAMPEP_0172324408 /NCGR_PEP_ID=MMETSP1058-20130122/51325_1 /TAXON_ID=83371 /ORGANISM="Detonula confervacea, Strain CCMP 353" /LENGTH=193 /DNA_ID=CAMNT_0013040683 /DNA_START=22 /DNA_END=600 /DNA_ORIENTATION=+